MTLDTPDGLPPGQWITPDPQYAVDSGYAVGSAAEPALWITDAVDELDAGEILARWWG